MVSLAKHAISCSEKRTVCASLNQTLKEWVCHLIGEGGVVLTGYGALEGLEREDSELRPQGHEEVLLSLLTVSKVQVVD